MNKNALKEVIKDIVNSYLNEIDVIEEAKRRKVVVRGGKRKRKLTSDPGQKIVGGKAVRMGSAERVKRKRGARKAAFKRKPKAARIQKKRKKSMKKRHTFGLDR